MEFLALKKGDKVIYLGSMPYVLGNGQSVAEEGEELLINSNVSVQKKFFKSADARPKVVEKKLEEMNKEELIAFADKNSIDVDKRKGEEKILVEIQEALKK